MKDFFNKKNINIWLGPILTIILSIFIIFINIYIGILGIIFSVISMIVAYEHYSKIKEGYKEYVDKLDIAFEGFTKNAIFSMPFSIAVINDSGNLIWYNNNFKEMINAKSSVVDEDLFKFIPVLERESIFNQSKNKFKINFELGSFEVHTNRVKTSTDEYMTLVYFIDVTEVDEVFNDYINEKMAVLDIRIDNYDDVYQSASSERRPIVFAEIDTIITSYFHKYGGIIKKNENDKYFAILYKSALENIKIDKFSFIEEIKNINLGNTIYPTMSIGVGLNEDSPRKNEKSSGAAIDIALGRGGDQVVFKSQEEISYLGGNSQATEKRTKVKARVIAHALAQLIEKSEEIFISGHKNPDMDSFGSSLGLWHAVRKKNKPAYIILSEVTPAIKNIYSYSLKNIEGLKDWIITPNEALEKAKKTSLLIVSDNHRINSTEEPKLFDIVNSTVVIDHHRRGKDYIKNSTLSYIEPYASSASELVTEMLVYMDERAYINKIVAEGLLAGIVVDTKSFNQQAGVRTFEAASILKRSGADSNIIKKLFADDLETIKYKSEIIKDAKIYKEKYVIGVFNHDIEVSTLIASQAADELLLIQEIEASFVFTISKGRVHISARSNGNISVQLIMEKLNGGGHRTVAATQMDTSIEEAIKLLKTAILEYNEEQEGDK